LSAAAADPRAIAAGYRPLRGFAGGHRMTIAAAYWPRRFVRAGRASVRHDVEVAPGVAVEVEIDEPDSPARGTLVLVHGLTGSARSSYLLGTADVALERGLRAARMNLRGCGTNDSRSPELYHGGMHGDVRAVVDWIGRRFPGPIVVAGFSLGGNLVANLAARTRRADGGRVAGFACVSAPLDLSACADRIDGPGLAAIYRRHFVSRLVAAYRRRARFHPDRFDPVAVEPVRTVVGFDDAVTAPCFGFADARHYYRAASALPLLGEIEIPTLLLCAMDDPIVAPETYEAARARAGSCLLVATPAHGGHLGFLSATRLGAGAVRSRAWAEHAVVDFFESIAFAGSGCRAWGGRLSSF
jgi:predicted alpha/beta-fold hydrolase